MHPTTARYLVESRQNDLRAEAARERLASQVRRAAAADHSAPATSGVLAATRLLVAGRVRHDTGAPSIGTWFGRVTR